MSGGRSELGTESLAAPSLAWLEFGLSKVDPNELSYEEWMSFTASYKQAGWSLTDPDNLLQIWLRWCETYHGSTVDINMKLWDSIRDTELGWKSFKYRTPIQAYLNFGHKEPPAANAPQQNDAMSMFGGQQVSPPPSTSITLTPENQNQQAPQMPTPPEQPEENFGEMLGAAECQRWFKECYFVEREGKMFTPSARFMNATQFNGKYGGKHFIITSSDKITDEAWKAATRSTLWTVPKVDHVRFVPINKDKIVTDDLGRKGLNTYIPAIIKRKQGDVTPWLDHVARIIPDVNDQKIWFDYMAHCVKFPGYKIPWAPMLQSAEGAGKGVFTKVMQHCLGSNYVYIPKADQLISSSNVFNAWMRSKLLILVNEIKVDERRELIEILKPMITDAEIEVQSKGVDQDMEDNVANWMFFSNYKDAIPINKSGRRYAIFYSIIQSYKDLLNAGMDDEYFANFKIWLEGDGLEAIAEWFFNYPIEMGKIPFRAPHTSSYAEAIERSRSPIERLVDDCVADQTSGFKGGFVSSIAVKNRSKTLGIRTPSEQAIQTCLEGMGYVDLGKSYRAYAQDDVNQKPTIYGIGDGLDVNNYGLAQGYE